MPRYFGGGTTSSGTPFGGHFTDLLDVIPAYTGPYQVIHINPTNTGLTADSLSGLINLTTGANQGMVYSNLGGNWGGIGPGAPDAVLTAHGGGADVTWTVPATLQQLLDALGNTEGSILYRGASAWAVLAPGANGNVLTTQGTGLDPIWGPPQSPGSIAVTYNWLTGLRTSTAGSSSTFSVAPGVAADSGNTDWINLSTNWSKTTSAWASGSTNGGLDTGTIANNTWYYSFVILNPTTPAVDVLFSLSPTAPTMPSGYTKFRRIGALRTDASAHFRLFTQADDEFLWDVSANDQNNGTVSSTFNLTVLVPPAITCWWLGSMNPVSRSGPAAAGITISSKVRANQGASNLPDGDNTQWTQATNLPISGQPYPIRCTDGQLRENVTAGSTPSLYVNTHGWLDHRGKGGLP